MSLIFRFVDDVKFSVEYYLAKLKSYRRYKGGTWYRVFPKLYPYMSYWTNCPLDNEVPLETEIYGGDDLSRTLTK